MKNNSYDVFTICTLRTVKTIALLLFKKILSQKNYVFLYKMYHIKSSILIDAKGIEFRLLNRGKK